MSQTEQPTARPGGAPHEPRPAAGRLLLPASPRRRAALIAGGVLLAVVAAVGALRLVHRGEVLPGVVMEGVDVGGLDREAARQRLADLVTQRREQTIAFTHDDQRFELSPGDATYGADLDAAVEQAYAVGRSGDPLSSSWAHVAARFGRETGLDLPDELQRTELGAWVDVIAAEVDTDAFPGAVTADPATLLVTEQAPARGVRVLRDQAEELAVEAVRTVGSDEFALPTETLEPPVAAEDVRRVADQARRALQAPLTLTAAHGATVVLRPSDLAPLIAGEVVGSGEETTFALRVPAPVVSSTFEPHLDALEVEPVDATFEVLDGLTTFDAQGDVTWEPQPAELRLVPSQDGYSFEAERIADQLSGLLAAATRQAELDLVVEEPQLTTTEARGLGVTDLIGTFTTYHSCCQNRVSNIQRMADLVRGAVLEPGAELSVNDRVGERTRAKGFLADGTIVGGEYVDEVGGGVSQFATTAYNAAFFAGIEIVEHKAHSYYISRYPMGREATLYYPSVDLRIRNDTDHGIFVHTSYTGTSITVSLFGDNGGRRVTAIHGEPHNHRSSRTVHRDDPDLPRGTERVVQGGGTGFDVTVTRVIEQGGSEERESISTRYEAPLRIVVRGTGEPRQRPTPDEDASPSDGGGSEADADAGADGQGGGDAGGSDGGGGDGDGGGGS